LVFFYGEKSKGERLKVKGAALSKVEGKKEPQIPQIFKELRIKN
jgi:hypothetical protein